VWPPDGAEPVDAAGLYPGLAAAGYEYGPVFRGVRAVWRRGADLFAEVALPEDAAADATGFGVHPALLDAALHAAGLADDTSADGPGDVRLPFAWTGVSLAAAGAPALRVRLRRDDDGALSLAAADATGMPVLFVDSLVTRPVAAQELASLRGGPPDALFGVEWVPVEVGRAAAGSWAVAGAHDAELVAGLAGAGVDVRAYSDLVVLTESVRAGRPVPDVVLIFAGSGPEGWPGAVPGTVREAVVEVLEMVQRWLGDERLEPARMVVVTRGAVASGSGESVVDLAGSAVWGLVRSAQTENPGRLVLVDLPAEGSDAGGAEGTLAAAAESGEPELAVRGHGVYVRRLFRVMSQARRADKMAPDPAGPRRDGTVLITGGTGMMGGVVARHLATAGRAEHVVLAGRSGPAAPGLAVLAADLADMGTGVQVTMCDAADRDALAGLLQQIPEARPLTGVVHAAGVIDDGVTGSLTAERVDAVMRPKADAAWNLHELTRHADLDMFTLFSSSSATFGTAGQGNYAAANAFLDGLASYRQAAGLPASSLNWGLWADVSAMTAHLTDEDRARMARGGMTPLTAEEGLALLDLAMTRDEAQLVPARIDLAVLRAQAAAGKAVPALLRGLTAVAERTPATYAAGGADAARALREKLAGLPAAERDRVLLDLVRAHVAAVLGHASPDAVEPGRAFKDLGFDSLTAVNLRNRLGEAIGLRLPATLIFNYPTPDAIVGYLRAKIADQETDYLHLLKDLDRLEAALPSIAQNNDDRNELRARLEALMRTLNSRPIDPVPMGDEFDSATDDEMFDLINKELGISG
jgi:acyl carrier protein